MAKYGLSLYVGLIITFLAVYEVNAADNGNIRQLKKLLAEQSKQLHDQQRALDAQNRQLNDLQSRIDALSGEKTSASEPAARKTGPSKTAKPASASTQAVAQTEPSKTQLQQQEGKPQPRLKAMPKNTRPPAIPRVSPDVGGVLTPQGRLVLEPLLQYTYSKSQRVALAGYTVGSALFIGIADVRDVRRETEMAALTGRYGLTDRFELEAKVPYLRREDVSQTRSVVNPNATDSFFNADGMDLGDIEVAGHYQINDGRDGWPFFIGNLRVKTDTGTSPFDMPIDADFFLPTKLNTGTGFWSFQPSITAIYPTDPAVFYANVSYLWNVERDIPNRVYQFRVRDENGNLNFINVKSGGKTDPGDAIGFSFGTSLAYNEKASFSLGYSHSIYFKTEQNGQNIEGTNFDIGQFTFGLNYAFAKKTSANLAVAVGATRDAPDVQMTLRVPVGFDIFD